MGEGNGKVGPSSPPSGVGPAPGPGSHAGARPLTQDEADEIRLAVGRLKNGAGELTAVALITPIFLAGVELAAQGFSSAARQGQVSETLIRDATQTSFEHVLFVAFFLGCVALALRARVGASRATKLLPDALAPDLAVREAARARLLRLAGPAPMRAAAEWVAAKWRMLLLVLVAIVVVANFLPVPNPVWLAVFLAILAGVDVRWRAMVADVADQLPRG